MTERSTREPSVEPVQFVGVEILRLQPGDTVIATMPDTPTADVALYLEEYFGAHLPEGYPVLVLGKDMAISVARPEPRPAPDTDWIRMETVDGKPVK